MMGENSQPQPQLVNSLFSYCYPFHPMKTKRHSADLVWYGNSSQAHCTQQVCICEQHQEIVFKLF